MDLLKPLKKMFQSRLWLMVYEVLILLTVLSYAILLIQNHFGTLSNERLKEELIYIDFAFIGFFMVEYLIRLFLAENKWHFVRKNWFDLIAMIPLDAYFRVVRIMRVIRLIRLIRISPALSAFFRSREIKISLFVVGLIVLWELQVFILSKAR